MRTYAGVEVTSRRNPVIGFFHAMLETIRAFFVSAITAIAGTATRLANRWQVSIQVSRLVATTWVDRNLRFLTRSGFARSQIGALTVETVVGFVVVAIIVAILVPIAINELTTTDTSGWDSRLVTIWTLLPVLIGVGLLLAFVTYWLTKRR